MRKAAKRGLYPLSSCVTTAHKCYTASTARNRIFSLSEYFLVPKLKTLRSFRETIWMREGKKEDDKVFGVILRHKVTKGKARVKAMPIFLFPLFIYVSFVSIFFLCFLRLKYICFVNVYIYLKEYKLVIMMVPLQIHMVRLYYEWIPNRCVLCFQCCYRKGTRFQQRDIRKLLIVFSAYHLAIPINQHLTVTVSSLHCGNMRFNFGRGETEQK